MDIRIGLAALMRANRSESKNIRAKLFGKASFKPVVTDSLARGKPLSKTLIIQKKPLGL